MKTQTFTLTVEINEKGYSTISSLNEGFSPLELLGILTFKITDIYQQMQHQVPPPKVVRSVTHKDVEDEIDDLRKVVAQLVIDTAYNIHKNE